MHALVPQSMECCSSFPREYRHHHNSGILGNNSSGVAYNNSHAYTNHLNALRYQPSGTPSVTNAPTTAMYRNGMGRASSSMYDSYDRYMYHPSTSPMSTAYNGYSPMDGAAAALGATGGYGYGNPNNNRSSAYYGYDSYRIPPMHPYQNHPTAQHHHLPSHHAPHHHHQQQQHQFHHRHQRDTQYSNTEMMYAARNGYLMRETPISMFHQGGGGREFGSSGGAVGTSGGYSEFAYHHQTPHHNHHNNANSREFYQSHTPHPLPSVIDPNTSSPVAATAAAASATPTSAVAVVPSTTPTSTTGSIYGEYPTVPTTPSPINASVTGPNCYSPSNLNSTEHLTPIKENKTRKIPRDKSLAKIAAMSRRLDSGSTTPLMFNDIDRAGTPTMGGHHHQLSPYHHHDSGGSSAGSTGYSPLSSRFHDDYMLPSPMQNSQSPSWHLAAPNAGTSTVTSAAALPPNTHWSNNQHNATRAYRKRKSASSDASLMLPSPPSGRLANQPSRESQKKIISGVYESDFIPSKKKKRKNQKEGNDTFDSREELVNVPPLPGFQQAFGSTEIGRFSEIFFNAPESPTEPFGMESEADTLSPQPWDMGDSLEGPLINLQFGVQSVYDDGYAASTDSPVSSSYFSEIRCNDF